MPQLFCIVDEGGRTLLVKTQGDIQTPSFPTVGLLCSISTYSETSGFSVDTFGTQNVQIVYKRCAFCTVACMLCMGQTHANLSAIARDCRSSDDLCVSWKAVPPESLLLQVQQPSHVCAGHK